MTMVLGGCAPQVSADPVAVEFAHPTIVSLNPCTDAILAEIAGPDQVLALSHYSRDPRASSMDTRRAQEFGVTGGTVEEVLALGPDLVVGSTFMPPAASAAFSDLDIAVESFGIAQDVEGSIAQIRRLAELSGREEQGEQLVQRIERALADSAAPAGSQVVSTVLWQPGGIVAGEGALVSQLLAHAGFTSHSAARGFEQADYLSLERVLSDPPELLLIAGNERGQAHPALAAVPEMKRAAFDPSLLYCGGPSILRVLERLRELRAFSAADRGNRGGDGGATTKATTITKTTNTNSNTNTKTRSSLAKDRAEQMLARRSREPQSREQA